ncbi:MAG: hypothetical protein WA810_15305, partial [Maribacter sp.]
MIHRNTIKVGTTNLAPTKMQSSNRPLNRTTSAPNMFSVTQVKLRTWIIDIVQSVRKESPFAFWVAILIFSMGIGCVVGILIDDRTLLGVSVWQKPLKFSISIGIYL